MRNLIRHWLGLDTDAASIHTHLTYLHDEMIGMRSDLAVTFSDEHDPKRKEMSDKLGARAIKRLQDEDKARRHALGEF